MSSKRQSAATTTVTRRTPIKIKVDTEVPAMVVDSAQKIKSYIWDDSCPFASLYVWIMILISLYYLFSLPKNVVYLDKDDTTIRVEKVTRTLRWWLFTTNLIMTGLGYLIIKRACAGAGSAWSGLWFIAAMVLSRLVSALILSSVENVVACKVPQ